MGKDEGTGLWVAVGGPRRDHPPPPPDATSSVLTCWFGFSDLEDLPGPSASTGVCRRVLGPRAESRKRERQGRRILPEGRVGVGVEVRSPAETCV